MKKIAVTMVLMMILLLGFSVVPARAGGGHFWGGFAAGTATGLVVGTIVAPRYVAPPVYYAPAPVYVAPAPTVCRDVYTEGYWRQVPMMDAGGYTTFRTEWVPATQQRICQ